MFSTTTTPTTQSYQFPVVMDQVETLLTRCYNCQSSYAILHEVLELDEMVVFFILTEFFGVLQSIDKTGFGSIREAISHTALQLTQQVMMAYAD